MLHTSVILNDFDAFVSRFEVAPRAPSFRVQGWSGFIEVTACKP